MCAKSKVFVQMEDMVPCKSLKIEDFPFDERPSYISTLSKTFVQMTTFQADASGFGSTGMPVSDWGKTREGTCVVHAAITFAAPPEATLFRPWHGSLSAERPCESSADTPGEGTWSLL